MPLAKRLSISWLPTKCLGSVWNTRDAMWQSRAVVCSIHCFRVQCFRKNRPVYRIAQFDSPIERPSSRSILRVRDRFSDRGTELAVVLRSRDQVRDRFSERGTEFETDSPHALPNSSWQPRLSPLGFHNNIPVTIHYCSVNSFFVPSSSVFDSSA